VKSVKNPRRTQQKFGRKKRRSVAADQRFQQIKMSLHGSLLFNIDFVGFLEKGDQLQNEVNQNLDICQRIFH